MPTILEHPDARELLKQTNVEASTLRSCRARLTHFIARYLPFFYRSEQRRHAHTLLEGKLTALDRKTVEPIAIQARQTRRSLQRFLGAGLWSDDRLRSEMARHVTGKIGEREAVLVLDPSAFPKQGNESCGVGRQWCGRLGKTENCQVGVFLAYSSSKGKALVDAQLYLQKERVADQAHRTKTHVPAEVTFQEKWRIGLDLLARRGSQLPHAWVCGDDELGRVVAFRRELRSRQEQYVLDVPCDTLIRDWSAHKIGGPFPTWERVDAWASRQPKKRWKRVGVKGGTKGPLVAWAIATTVQTKEEGGVEGMVERLVVIRSGWNQGQIWYVLSDAPRKVPLKVLVRVHGSRHGIEELFEEGNQEIGLSHYEVRSWTGWSHHVTLSLLALWFLQLEKGHIKKDSRDHGVVNPKNLQ